ncbi:hypothetical protein [Deinococcus sp.]|uniref:hypothetical protein n=1 Tax=Deinococcus sp. TaxID=47478 RepID=UPI003C7A37B4
MTLALWLALGLFLLAFAVFEATKHLGWTMVLAAVGLGLPALSSGVPRLRRVFYHPALPIVIVAAFTVLPGTTDQIAPGFTFGLTWLAHLALARALSGLRRARI